MRWNGEQCRALSEQSSAKGPCARRRPPVPIIRAQTEETATYTRAHRLSHRHAFSKSERQRQADTPATTFRQPTAPARPPPTSPRLSPKKPSPFRRLLSRPHSRTHRRKKSPRGQKGNTAKAGKKQVEDRIHVCRCTSGLTSHYRIGRFPPHS